jgi:hypothetical protein
MDYPEVTRTVATWRSVATIRGEDVSAGRRDAAVGGAALPYLEVRCERAAKEARTPPEGTPMKRRASTGRISVRRLYRTPAPK